ncbi:MAG: amidohydrolase family protein [Hyphomicrobiales bacterium]|nr:amidohydrolase family protein [Hyphomicrobiales bacterium]
MTASEHATIGRREVLGAIGGGIAAATVAAGEGRAQDKPAPTLKVVDFHNHYVGPAFTLTTMGNAPPAQRENQAKIDAMLANPRALLDSLEVAGIAARVINTPTAFLQDADGEVPKGAIPRINDEVANLVSKHPGKLIGLATVDAYSGDDGARELTRAVRELGLRGVFIESAKKDLFPNAPQARPTLATAAALGIPVFVHPITDPSMHKRFGQTGRQGVRLARATINALALISMLEGGVFDELPKLRVVVTTLAIGGVMMAGGFGDGQRIRRDTPELVRRHVYIDTMGLHPALVSSVVELLGADHVMAGTDWPIVVEKDVPGRLQKALTVAGLDAEQQKMVASGNALKLLGLA